MTTTDAEQLQDLLIQTVQIMREIERAVNHLSTNRVRMVKANLDEAMICTKALSNGLKKTYMEIERKYISED